MKRRKQVSEIHNNTASTTAPPTTTTDLTTFGKSSKRLRKPSTTLLGNQFAFVYIFYNKNNVSRVLSFLCECFFRVVLGFETQNNAQGSESDEELGESKLESKRIVAV